MKGTTYHEGHFFFVPFESSWFGLELGIWDLGFTNCRPADNYILYFPSSSGSRLSSHF